VVKSKKFCKLEVVALESAIDFPMNIPVKSNPFFLSVAILLLKFLGLLGNFKYI